MFVIISTFTAHTNVLDFDVTDVTIAMKVNVAELILLLSAKSVTYETSQITEVCSVIIEIIFPLVNSTE